VSQSNRQFFVGAHVTPQTKQALTKEAKRRGWSASRLVAFAVVKLLQNWGHKIEDDEACATSSDTTR